MVTCVTRRELSERLEMKIENTSLWKICRSPPASLTFNAFRDDETYNVIKHVYLCL